MYATNNTFRTPAQYISKPGLVLASNPKNGSSSPPRWPPPVPSAQRWPDGGPIHMLGEVGLRKVMEDKGFYHADEDVLAVVSGLDKSFTYNMFVKANPPDCQRRTLSSAPTPT